MRGESTGRYLERLGFVRDRHFSVVGCPTLYTYGPELPPLAPPRRFERCAFHLNVRAPVADRAFVVGCAESFRESHFVSQFEEEFRRFLLADSRTPTPLIDSDPGYVRLLRSLAEEGRLRFFLNRRPWMDFLSGMDFSIGHRIHGTLLSLLAGTPAAVVPFESRTQELAAFHGLPVLSRERLGETPDWRAVLASLDYSEVRRHQSANFANWLAFLRENGLRTVFDGPDGPPPSREDYPLELLSEKRHFDDDVRGPDFDSFPTRSRIRLALATEHMKGKLRRIKNRIVRQFRTRPIAGPLG